ncbi:uncharacterized protein LOC134277781, partial [Saccostrea cucullata]|uniref:uncharacterized protein LOC134277781 n=1 Tax=Saccostrea cuccullata TaxID=36930 RepID=UPI002ED4F2F1
MGGGSTETGDKTKDDKPKTDHHCDEDEREITCGLSLKVSSEETELKLNENETKNVENICLKTNEESEKKLEKQLEERKVVTTHETSSMSSISSPLSSKLLTNSQNSVLTNDVQNKDGTENSNLDEKQQNRQRKDPLEDEMRMNRCHNPINLTSEAIKAFERNRENITRAFKDLERLKHNTTQNNAKNHQQKKTSSQVFKFEGTTCTQKEDRVSKKIGTFSNAHNLKTKSLVFKLPSSETIRKQFPQRANEKAKMACNRCNSWCLYWNVCRDCMVYLCDSCTEIYPHSPDHTTIRAKAFSDFGCLDHIQIFKYFCPVCSRYRCGDCIKLGKCQGHELKDAFVNQDQTETSDRFPAGMKLNKEIQTTFEDSSPSSIKGGALQEHFCGYCQMSKESYNICEDCMIYLCETCMGSFHPKDHTICKQVPFHVFGCSKHKQICRYFCNFCQNLRCDDCILANEQCSGHADKLVKILDHIKYEKDKFDEAVQQFSSRSSRSINVLSDRLEEIEETISMNGILNKEILRQEFASLHQLITEREQRLYQNFDQEYGSCLKRIQQYKRRYGSIMQADSKLISTSLQFLGKESLMEFFFSAEKIWKRFDKHKKNLEYLPSPDALLQSPILSPMSLYVEKSELDKSLQFNSLGPCSISCRRYVVYIEDVKAPIRIDDFISIPSPTLSKSLSICVEILTSVKRVISRSVHHSLDEYVANAKNLISLEPSHRYIFKFHVQTSFQMSDKRITKRISSPCHILVITDKAPIHKEEKQPKMNVTKCEDFVKTLISRVERKLKLKDDVQHEEKLDFC